MCRSFLDSPLNFDTKKFYWYRYFMYNDDPHGVFGIIPEYQTVIVDPVDLSRYVRLNFTRYRGQFGTVILTFNIKYDIPQSGIVLKVNDPTVTFNENEEKRIVDIEIMGTGFLEVATTFSLSLSEVQFLGPGVTAPPTFQSGQTEAKVYVPALAANSKVGFKETIAAVDEESSTCRLTVVREGMYGTLEVSWQSGFQEGRVPYDFVEGTMTPDSSSVRIPHGIDEKNFTVSLTARWDVPELFALHLPVAPSTTVAGGARLSEGRTLVRIEPYGLLRFADNSTTPSVSEMFGKIYLHVLRLYGSEGKIEARYRTEGISAMTGIDFNTIENHAVVMEPGQTSALIMIEVLQDNTPEQKEIFHVNLTDIEKFPTETAPSISPRISYIHPSSVVTIAESNDPYGVLHIEPAGITVTELYQQVNLTVKRTGGIFGTVSVIVRTVGGGEGWTSQINPKEGNGNNTIREVLFNRDKLTSATSSVDYVVLDISVTFQQGETEKSVELTILSDDLAEPDETVLVYLTQPTGGARIAEGEPDGGRKGFAVVTIARNDLSNGLIGFSAETLNVVANEDARIPATFKLVRTVAIYGQVEITWKAKLSVDSTEAEDVMLAADLQTTSGTAICPGQQKYCHFNVTLTDDDEPEEEESFVVELVSVQNDAKLDPEASVATVTVEPSDFVRGLVEFTDESRDIVVSNLESDVRLGVRRVMGQDYRIEVAYRTVQMNRQETINGVTVSPALEGEDYEKQSGQLVFEPERQEIKYIDINLTPFLASQSKYPKQFYIELGTPSNGASLNQDAYRAYILIAEPKDIDIWDIINDIKDKPLVDDNIRDIIDKLDDDVQVNEEVTEDQMSLMEEILNDIVDEGLKRKLPTQLVNQLVSLLCKLLSPNKNDATRGRYQLAIIMENVAYMLLTDGECPSPNPPKLHTKQCPYASIAAGRWPVGKIEGYKYPGQRQDEFLIPTNIPNIPENTDTECKDFHLIEYTSEQWFQRGEKKELLSNKVVSFGLRGRQSTYTDYPVKFRIHSPDRRIATSRAQCVYFDMGLKQWVSPNEICQVTNDLDLGVDDFVDCSCRHLTHYAVKAKTSDRGLVGYSVWFFVSCFICMTGLLLAILAHHICSISAMFSASLLMHMCFAAMATQICYVVAAYLSPDEIIVYTIGEDNYRCIVMGLFLHYFFLCQFSWMMTQALNFWKILVLNDEHTDRKYVLFFLLGWGIPVVIVAVFYVVTFNLYKYVYELPYDFIYGDVNNNGQICFITNPYAGLGGLILPVLLMLVVVAVVFVKAFQLTPQWQAYDDIYRGRYNISEVRTLLLFWAVIIVTWLWGGLHLVYGHLWMLIMFCIFNILQGVMAFILYSLLRNPCLVHCLGPQRASSYSMTGHMFDPNHPQTVTTPGAGQYQFHPTTLDVGSLKGSRASLLNESWERDSIPGSRTTRSTMKVKRTLPQGGNIYIEPPVYRQNTISDTKDFDDLLYALKTGGSFTPSDVNSGESDRASEVSSNIDKYELRRIDIADTHL